MSGTVTLPLVNIEGNSDAHSDIQDSQLLPLRMLNEFTYCPRLGYLEWVQGEWAENSDTMDGDFVHRHVDKTQNTNVPVASSGQAKDKSNGGVEVKENDVPIGHLHARSLKLENEELGLVAVVDVVEVEGRVATPIDYKKGTAPDIPEGAWEPERVQLCAQGLLLRAAGYECTKGFLWFAASRRRVVVPFDESLVSRTRELMNQFRQVAQNKRIPPPLVDSPKCPRCSLVGICLPDETHLLSHLNSEAKHEELLAESTRQTAKQPRQLLTPSDATRPLHVMEQGARVGKTGDRIRIENKEKKLAEVPLHEVSQLCIFGNVQVSTQTLAELMDRGIPVCYFTTGGWFRGMTTGLMHRNVELRIRQFAVAADAVESLKIARSMIAGKIRNCRTLLRRNLEEKEDDGCLSVLKEFMGDADRAGSSESLLGIEGMAAKRYFAGFAKLIHQEGFVFNRRNRRPPTDPVNAVMSFLYSMLTKECHIACWSAGFDPMLGFLHQPRYGRPSLALDLAEEFRPLLADSTTLTLFNTGEVQSQHFLERAGACVITPNGKRNIVAAWERRLNAGMTHPIFGYELSYRRVVSLQARLLSRVLLGEIPDYPPIRTR